MPRPPPGAVPKPPDNPIKFYRVATQRFAEAEFLFLGERYALSTYVAGYAVECGLKALILATVPRSEQAPLSSTFRGSEWHNLNWMFEGYLKRGGPPPLKEIRADLTYVHDAWSVDLRYVAGEKPFREAVRFIRSTERILEWVKGRI